MADSLESLCRYQDEGESFVESIAKGDYKRTLIRGAPRWVPLMAAPVLGLPLGYSRSWSRCSSTRLCLFDGAPLLPCHVDEAGREGEGVAVAVVLLAGH
jgi:hypothetical protein